MLAKQSLIHLIDPDSAAEMGRLLMLNRTFNEATGGPLAERNDQESIHSVLDVNCGPGGWVICMAHTYPHMRITGIDSNPSMIQFARSQAIREKQGNVSFELMNTMEPFQFPDNAFDLVNIRFAAGTIPRHYWPSVLSECFRVTHPGGSLRLTELDHTGITNSAAYGRAHHLISTMLHKAGYGFSPDGSTYCLTPMFKPLLSSVGYTNIQHKPFAIDISHGSTMLAAHWQNLCIVLTSLETPFEYLGMGSREEVRRIQAEAEEDILKYTFCGMVYLLTAWGYKPA